MPSTFFDLVERFESAPWGSNLPGLTLAAMRDGEAVYTGAFGYANLEARLPCTPRTIFHVGSITKVVTAIMLMQLRDGGKLDLDEIVARWVPEMERVPGGMELTFRQLATHTSGLPREAPLDYFETLRFPEIEEVLESLRAVRLVFAPGDGFQYSNLGYAVLGHALAVIAEQPYEQLYKEYIHERTLLPLGMADSGFDPVPEIEQRVAIGYERASEGGFRRSKAKMDLRAFAPAGQLYSSVEDLSRLMRLQLGCEGNLLLSADSLRELQEEVLGWASSSTHGMRVIGYNGQTFASAADLQLIPERGIGVAACTNTRTDLRPVTDGLLDALLSSLDDAPPSE